jgi:hypothetical protein
LKGVIDRKGRKGRKGNQPDRHSERLPIVIPDPRERK